MTSTKLLPCPFCGSKDIDFGKIAIGNFVSCSRCKAEIFHSNHAILSPRAWNIRAIPEGFALVPIEQIKELGVLADAYDDANEYDYCSDAYPEHEGCRPDELANKFVRIGRKIAAAQKKVSE